MNKYAVVLLLGASVSLSGCVISVDGDRDNGHTSSWESKERKNRKHIAQLQPDVSYDYIANMMGIADFNELYKKDNDTYQVLYYRTQKMESDGVTTKDECTPLVFKNGSLVGWGDSAYKLIN